MPFVTILPGGQATELEPGAPLTDIELAFDEAAIDFGCRVGSCGSCVVEIVSFNEPLQQGDEDERSFLHELGFAPDRHRLACQTRVHAALTIRAPQR